MKRVASIEMANDKDIYHVRFHGDIEVSPAGGAQGGFDIAIAGEAIDWAEFKEQAAQEAEGYIVDEDLVVSGFGKHSGRKFWQLPQKLQREVIRAAKR